MYAVGHCMSKSLSMVWGVWRGGKDFDAAKPAGVGEQKSIQLGWPACSLLKTTQSERDTTCHNPTIPSRKNITRIWTDFCPPYIGSTGSARIPVCCAMSGSTVYQLRRSEFSG